MHKISRKKVIGSNVLPRMSGNRETGSRGRTLENTVTWGAPRRLQERWNWGQKEGPRRWGESLRGTTFSDVVRRNAEKCISFPGGRREIKKRRDKADQRMSENVGRNALEAIPYWSVLGISEGQGLLNFSSSKVLKKNDMALGRQSKVRRGYRQKKWGRKSFFRGDLRVEESAGERLCCSSPREDRIVSSARLQEIFPESVCWNSE